MRSLTLRGVAPAEAARIALAQVADPERAQQVYAEAALAIAESDAGAASGRAGGGPVVPVGPADPAARGLARAAQALDAARASVIVTEALNRDGVTRTWENLLVPVLVGLGRRWESGRVGVDVEHLMSECVLSALRDAQHRQPQPVSARPVLLAAAEDEQHTLPIHAVAAALAERRVASLVLGARVPASALADAVRRSGPGAVFVWSQTATTGWPGRLVGLPHTRPPVTYVVGGPGWGSDLPPEVTRVDSLAHAVSVLARAAG